ncbi:MAG: DNA repair protein RecN [Prevotella sp.]|nr:DNA repair protein RecN [Prevotella sp.]
MIKQLYIKNFTLIDEQTTTFDAGFSVITGETGAGKSIILGAIGLLLGNRADIKLIKADKDRCVVEAHFDLSKYDLQPFFIDNDIDYDAQDCIVRREININGKSRAFINDTPVSLAQMRELGEQLVDIHSQHQNLLLNKEDFQLDVLDTIAQNVKQKDAYTKVFNNYKSASKQLEELKVEIEKNKANEDFLRFQYDELHSVQLKSGEQEELEQQSEMMNHAEDIKTALYSVENILDNEQTGIVGQMRSITTQLNNIANVFPSISELLERAESSRIELKDIAQDVSRKLEQVDFNPRLQEEINQRLDTIYSLQQKHHVATVDELIDLHDRMEKSLNQIENSDEQLQTLEKQVNALHSSCVEKARALTKTRTQAALTVEKEMQKYLVPLGIPNVRFQVQTSAKDLSADGADKVAFLFSANKSTPMQPVSQVASGGEIARVMLSLKAMISGAKKLPTIIFDEIDTGVSGRVAEKMAQIMHDMGANNRQVISITHLPQIAAMGNAHYRVTKEETKHGTISNMALLTPEERINEIAQMLSGSEVTQAAISNAKELLKSNGN